MNELATHDIVAEIRSIARIQRLEADTLWSTTDISEYVGVSPKTAAQHIVTQPGFPRPVGVRGAHGERRWFSGEIREWYKRKRS